MFSLRTRQGGVLLFLIATLLAPRQNLMSQEISAESWIAQLDHARFTSRQAAANSLRTIGLQEWRLWMDRGMNLTGGGVSLGTLQVGLLGESVGPVTEALHAARTHESLEIRLAAARILRELVSATQDAELERLLNPRSESSAIRLAYWPAFNRLAGDDMPARVAFAAITARTGEEFLARSGGWWGSDPVLRFGARLDPYRVSADDGAAWMLLMMLDLQRLESLRHLTPRLATAMSRRPMGPAPSSQHHSVVFGRILDRWLRDAAPLGGDRERLLIAMRYQRREAARELAVRLLAERGTPAATTVTALLVASAIDCEEIEPQARRRINDHRVAIIGQSIVSRQTPVRTQVDDVAVALLLHHRGIDPRSAGYSQLQADPLFPFQDQSLGFSDDPARQASRRLAAELLGK